MEYESDGSALCIQNIDDKIAAHVKDPMVAGYAGRPVSDPLPLRVGLANGVTCSIASHDHGQHWNGRYSWYPCTDGSELLTKDASGISRTFSVSGNAWRVQVSKNRQAPVRQTLAWAEYAGKK
jgi:hypothetical protein